MYKIDSVMEGDLKYVINGTYRGEDVDATIS